MPCHDDLIGATATCDRCGADFRRDNDEYWDVFHHHESYWKAIYKPAQTRLKIPFAYDTMCLQCLPILSLYMPLFFDIQLTNKDLNHLERTIREKRN